MNDNVSRGGDSTRENEPEPTWSRVFEFKINERDLNQRDEKGKAGREYYDEMFGEGNWKFEIPADEERLVEDAEHATDTGIAKTALSNLLAGEGYHVEGKDMTGRAINYTQDMRMGYVLATEEGLANREIWQIQHEKPLDNDS